ncbi:jg20054 [Pararge aegeria aegeria]|uniref:Jg20054 protein n=1 Tax=Pararge aegeria aegeria TaxID=348720 RepID=A0A8S4RBH6_9NEOP|nr:jg20054 [Pararge aegeria aegeria]
MSSDLRYSSRMRSVRRGTRGRSQRAALISAAAGAAGLLAQAGGLGASGPRRRARWRRSRRIMQWLTDLPHV